MLRRRANGLCITFKYVQIRKFVNSICCRLGFSNVLFSLVPRQFARSQLNRFDAGRERERKNWKWNENSSSRTVTSLFANIVVVAHIREYFIKTTNRKRRRRGGDKDSVASCFIWRWFTQHTWHSNSSTVQSEASFVTELVIIILRDISERSTIRV